jgi:membrane protease YdiL (CAAX protease family)
MNKIVKFFIVVFIFSWLLWSGAVINSQFIELPDIFLLLSMFASFVPSIVGIVYLVQEKKFKSLFSKFKFTPLLLGVYLFLPITAVITLWILKEPISIELAPFIVSFFVMMVIGGALGEEFGWRGYILPYLFEEFGKIKGTLILGIIWSLWHLPLFFIIGTVQNSLPLWQFLLQNTIIAFYYSYIYLKTNGNILMAILFHTVGNWTSFVFPTFMSTNGRFLNFGFLVVGLILITAIDKDWYKNEVY